MKTEDLNIFKLNIVSDILLTPLACSSLVNEILKGILYQKCQIPYPYEWMKTMVTRKRQKTEEIDVKKFNNIKATNHFLLVSSFLDKLETAMQAIKHEFSLYKTDIQEVLIVLGTTPHTANEILSVNFTLVDGHNERNHISQLNKYQQKILRKLFLSQDWLDKIDASMACTNVYLYIVKTGGNTNINSDNTSVFVPTIPLTVSTKTKYMKISLKSETELDTNCCENLTIFNDSSNLNVISKECDNEETEIDVTWYKYKDLIKGFKDCYVNKKSVSESW